MLKFYYSKGSSAVAAHILLEDVNAEYEAIEVSIPKGEHSSPEFLAINPKGRIPVLVTPNGALSENPAILEYIAETHPSANVMPTGVYAKARARSVCAYLCATAHVAFAHSHRGKRWAQSAAAIEEMKARAPANLVACAKFLEQDLVFGPWALGASYSFVDPYLFQFSRWLEGVGGDVRHFEKLYAFREAMLERATTQRVLALHQKV